MEERDKTDNVEYRIEIHSGRGKSKLQLLKKDKDSGKIYMRSYHESKEPKLDDEGNAWREVPEELFDPAFYGFDDDYDAISSEEAEALIIEQETTGKTEWRCPGLFIAAEGLPDDEWDNFVMPEENYAITEEEALAYIETREKEIEKEIEEWEKSKPNKAGI